MSATTPDAHVAKLIGERAEEVLALPGKRTPLDVDPIEEALAAGNAARVVATAARILIYRDGDETKAAVIELPHGGYRRRYRAYAAPTATELVEKLRSTYPS